MCLDKGKNEKGAVWTHKERYRRCNPHVFFTVIAGGIVVAFGSWMY